MEALIVLSVTNMGVGDGESVPLADVRVRRESAEDGSSVF